jgi:hypothetical protein
MNTDYEGNIGVQAPGRKQRCPSGSKSRRAPGVFAWSFRKATASLTARPSVSGMNLVDLAPVNYYHVLA